MSQGSCGCGGNCGCKPKGPAPKEFVFPQGYKARVEGCPSGVPIPVRPVGGNVINDLPVGCMNTGEAARLLFAENSQRTKVIIHNSPTSQGILYIKGNATPGVGGLAVGIGGVQELEYTGPIYICVSDGTVSYTAIEIAYA